MRCLVKRGGAERIYPESGEAITPWDCRGKQQEL
jgi:hypothetical protein